MDRKQLISSIVVALAVLGLWYGFMQILQRMEPQLFTQPAQQASVPTTQPSTTQPAEATTTRPAIVGVPTTMPATGPAVATVPPLPATAPASAPVSQPAIVAVPEKGTPHTIELGVATPSVSAKSQFVMGVVLNPIGASIENVTLNRFGSSANRKLPYTYQQPYAGQPDSASLATRSIVINGNTVDLAQTAWKELPGNDSTQVTFELPLVTAAGKPVATLKKAYTLSPAGTDPKTSQGYEVNVAFSVQNQSDGPISVQATYNGPTMPPQEMDRSEDRMVIVASSTTPNTLAVTQHYIGEYKVGAAEQDLSKEAVWVGEASAYFNAIVLPSSTPTAGAAKEAYTIKATALTPDATDKCVVLTFTSPAQTIAANHSISLGASAFFGPKWRDLLDSPYYTAYPRGYDQSLIIHGSCSFLTFGWLVWWLVDVLRFFHIILFHDWGLAIIALVCCVRLPLHPITKASQVNMLKMGKMGPEIERLKKKYGDDKDALNKAMMDVYKNQGLAPVLGCLPMFLQMPIWIALWGALQSTFELRQAPFLWGLTWIKDLAKPDTLPYLSWPAVHVPLLSSMMGPISGVNLLPILMGVVFYFQQKYTPKPVAATPEQEKQQKMMQWMSLLFPLFLYNGPSGLNLYIATSTTIGIFENKIIRKHIKDREEAEKAGRVIVETKPTRGKKNLPMTKKDEGKKSKLGRWMSDLQTRAEQLQKESDRKKRRET